MAHDRLPHLVVFTHVYPYGPNEFFLETEIPYLAERFPQVTIVSRIISGKLQAVPANVEVDTSYAQSRANGLRKIVRSAYYAAASPDVYGEISTNPHILTNFQAFVRLINFNYNGRMVYDWLIPRLQKGHFDIHKTLFYTVWLVPEAIGLSLIKKHYPSLKMVSRAHRVDLYENTLKPPYLPLQEKAVQAANRVFAISEHGKNYLLKRYPDMAPAFEVAPLGTRNPGFSVESGSAETVKIVSVSRLIELKRIPLLIESLAQLAKLKPDLKIEWHHFGDGPLRGTLENQAEKLLQGKIDWAFHGLIPNEEVFAFYRTYSPDVFINLSEIEGIPVSIMEAQSCGIPVIATDVGATNEIVNHENGILVGANPTVEAVALAMKQLSEDVDARIQKGENAKRYWAAHFDASRNCQTFAQRLVEIFNEP